MLFLHLDKIIVGAWNMSDTPPYWSSFYYYLISRKLIISKFIQIISLLFRFYT